MIMKPLVFTQNYVRLFQWPFECNAELYQKGTGIRKMEIIAVCGVAGDTVTQVSFLKTRKLPVTNKRIGSYAVFSSIMSCKR